MVSALIIRKPTNLEQHQTLLEQKLIPAQSDPSYMDFITRAHEEHYACRSDLIGSLSKLGVKIAEAGRGEELPKQTFDFIIALGGDGTLITASYGISDDTPLIGIKSSSASVGFLCAADHSTLAAVMHNMLEGRLEFVRRQRLRAQIQRADGQQESSPFMALNDFLYAACSPAATTRYRMASHERVESHKSSGIWISTATGSTAAISAAGGIPMAADDKQFQFLVRELYRRQEDGLGLTHGFSDPEQDSFWIENQCPSAILALDGEKWLIKVGFGDVIRFRAASPVRVALRPAEMNPV